MKWKAKCAVNILSQLVQRRESQRSAAAALASSQGQEPPPAPGIIMAGDLNCTPKAMKDEITFMYFDFVEEDRHMFCINRGNMFAIADCEVELYEGLPSITGADNRHESHRSHSGACEELLS